MALLRVFEPEGWFKAWTSAKPKLEDLLKCLDITKPAHPEAPISVFKATTAVEEVECVAAFYETFNRRETKIQYAIRVEGDDCRRAGICVEHRPDEGTTGIKQVDRRHFNLRGKQADFAKLAGVIVASLWEGQDRLRAFPAHSIRAQLAVFTCIDKFQIDPAASQRCKKLLERNPELQTISPDRKYVEICGELADGTQSIPIVATRHVRGKLWWLMARDFFRRTK